MISVCFLLGDEQPGYDLQGPEGVLFFHCSSHRHYAGSSESTGEAAEHDQHGQASDGVQAL